MIIRIGKARIRFHPTGSYKSYSVDWLKTAGAGEDFIGGVYYGGKMRKWVANPPNIFETREEWPFETRRDAAARLLEIRRYRGPLSAKHVAKIKAGVRRYRERVSRETGEE